MWLNKPGLILVTCHLYPERGPKSEAESKEKFREPDPSTLTPAKSPQRMQANTKPNCLSWIARSWPKFSNSATLHPSWLCFRATINMKFLMHCTSLSTQLYHVWLFHTSSKPFLLKSSTTGMLHPLPATFCKSCSGVVTSVMAASKFDCSCWWHAPWWILFVTPYIPIIPLP